VLADLIYDVGLHDGTDTRHYLDSGYRVVAVEANPVFVARARDQFADEIAAGQLVIVESAVGPEVGRVLFWVNDDNTEWSSLNEAEGARYGTRAHVIEVDCVRFDSVVEQHGVPYYLKIDIERASSHCLQALSPPDIPAYVSIEAHTVGYLGMLSWLGYDQFKLIDQRTHRAIERHPEGSARRFPPEQWRDRGHRLRASGERVARHIPGARRTYRALFDVAAREAKAAMETRSFGASGPFAEDTRGEWRALDEVAFDYLRLRTPDNPSWYDFHARIRPEQIGQ
jgi:FkbM family methyltransferase